ncbi:electron transfer flavoprotein subunit alpha/FixB family protein [Methyloversatilis discipulorum]|uniref:electron transfer flavoprotein subunit alpha/FixB family protein n=1 Tax=Methyloversatilis discipulorum TaxID=1119528 RepID=UPI003AF8ECB0
MKTLVIAEHDNAVLQPVTLHAVTAALQCGGEIDVLVAGRDCAAVVGQVRRIAGVARVLHADAAHYADQLAEPLAELLRSVLADAAGQYTHVVAAAGGFARNLLPRVAARLGVAPITDVVRIESSDTFVRPIYAGNVLVTVQSLDALKVLTVRATAFAPAANGSDCPVLPLPAAADPARSRLVARQRVQGGRPDLGSARVVVSGGRALGSADNFRRLLEPLADSLNAALGASRAAVDAGFVGNDSQVGQTGRVVAPELYIAVGISGAIQHVAGMKDSRVIVAINQDADAPIFGIADYGLVADLFEAVPALTRELAAARKSAKAA